MMRTLVLAAGFALSLLGAACTQAATYYTSPMENLATALDRLHPGDTLYLRGGVYTQPLDLAERRYPHLSGTPGAWTTIAAAPGETVTLRPGNARSVVRIAGTAATPYQYVSFDRLQMDATGGGYGISWAATHAEHIRFQDGAVFGGSMSGISGMGNYGEVLRMQIYNNGGTNRLSHGLYVCPQHARIQGNDIYGNGGYGLQLYSPGHPGCADGTQILGNTIHDNLGDGGVVLGSGSDILFQGNTVTRNQGGGIRPICYGGALERIQVVQNVITDNAGVGIAVCDAAKDTVITDNVITGNQGTVSDAGWRTVLARNGAAGVVRPGGTPPPPSRRPAPTPRPPAQRFPGLGICH